MGKPNETVCYILSCSFRAMLFHALDDQNIRDVIETNPTLIDSKTAASLLHDAVRIHPTLSAMLFTMFKARHIAEVGKNGLHVAMEEPKYI